MTEPTPEIRPARWQRRAAAGAGAALLLGLALMAAEAAGWPFLVGPMQRALGDLLERPVQFAASVPGQPQAESGVRIQLLGGLRVTAPYIEVGAPAWSPGAPLLRADHSTLAMRYRDLWLALQGEPLRVERIEAQVLRLDLRREADGRANWDPIPRTPAARPPGADALVLPSFDDLRIAQGQVRFSDAVLDSEVSANFSLAESSLPDTAAATPGATASAPDPRPAPAPGGRLARTPDSTAAAPDGGAGRVETAAGLHVRASGRYRRLPLNFVLDTDGLLPWVDDAMASSGLSTAQAGVPLVLRGQLGRARLQFDGQVRDVRHLAGLSGRFNLAGPSLAAVGDVIGMTLPTTAAFSSRGVLVRQGPLWNLRVDQALIGGSRLTAALRYDTSPKTPLLIGRLGGSRLLLADLGPVVGTTGGALPGSAPAAATTASGPGAAEPTPRGRVLPRREFDLPSLRAMDANVLIDFAELDLGTPRLQPLKPLQAHLTLKSGVLDLDRIDARTADGRLQGHLSLDGREVNALWRSDLRWSQVRLERWLQLARAPGQPAWVTGRLTGRATLEGRGRSTAQILASLNGDIRSQLRGGSISHLLVEAAGLDLAQGLGVLLKGDEALPMSCAVADLQVRRGVARPRVMLLDTRDSLVRIDGSVSLADESLDLVAVVSPKDISPLALRTPLRVRGSLGAPEVSLAPGPIGAKLLASGLLALVNPLAALLPLIDLGGDTDKAAGPGDPAGDCKRLLARAVPAAGK